jgi:hypothetical protein
VNGYVTSVSIPDTVTNIGASAFANCGQLTNITIGAGVVAIGEGAFLDCPQLGAITVDPNNLVYASVDGVLFNKDQSVLVACPGALSGSYSVPETVTNIAEIAFGLCEGLTEVVVPGTVSTIGDSAFGSCSNLSSVFFDGNAPTVGQSVFAQDPATAYYLAGTTGWNEFSAATGLPAVVWNPVTQSADSSHGVRSDRMTNFPRRFYRITPP